MARRTRQISINEWLTTQEWLPSALARLAEPKQPLTLASLRTSAAETDFQDSVAKIVARYPIGDDPASEVYQAHSFIREQEIGTLFRMRWDAQALELGRKTLKERSEGGSNGGGKANKAAAEAWQKNATPIYRELRAEFPKTSAHELAWKIESDPRVRVPGVGRVERWVSYMDKKRAPASA
jgi:hypothetical protein